MTASTGVDRGEYCRRVEAHLCRRNAGHLIRIAGPAFETVRGWADRGVPLAIALQGIDRYVERTQARGPRRRPVQVQFCEPDVLDLFDDWRRTLGVTADVASPGGDGASDQEGRRHGSLSAHLERAIARLTVLRGSGAIDEASLDAVIRELDSMRAQAKGLRGPAREACLDRLRALEVDVTARVVEAASADALAAAKTEALEELKPFKERLPPEAYARAYTASIERILRDRARVPQLAFD